MWKVNFSYAKPQILIAFYYPEMFTIKILFASKKERDSQEFHRKVLATYTLNIMQCKFFAFLETPKLCLLY